MIFKTKTFLITLFCGLLCVSVFADEIDDESIIDAENSTRTHIENEFSLQSFSSCDDMSTVVRDYLKESIQYQNYYPYYRGGLVDGVMVDAEDAGLESVSADTSKSSNAPVAAEGIGGGGEENIFSDTNIQVEGVDEAEIVKTDGDYIYFYHQVDKDDYQSYAISIAKVKPGNDIQVIKRIKIPGNYSNVQMFLSDDKLIALANRYDYSYQERYISMNSDNKVAVMIFDIARPETPDLERFYLVDGYLSQSRRIGDKLYILSQNSIYLNPWVLYQQGIEDQDAMIKRFDQDFDLNELMPQAIDIAATDEENKQVTTQKGNTYPYSVSRNTVARCDQIDYYLPDSETQKEYNTQPNFLVMSIIDIDDPQTPVSRKVIFGDANQIYMGLEDLYIISSHYSPAGSSCPPNAMCIWPGFPSYQNSIVHKFEIDGDKMDYINSALVAGQPLTQYAMHDDGKYFYTVNQVYAPERSSNLFVLDENLELAGSLEKIAPGEDFRSSRFLGDKLYLVTFEQTDPLFSIDLSTPKKPKILGELKIPGYSTYLHPYDDDHLIGIGYDTKENQWGGIVNTGIKVDLYDISDFNNPKQQYTMTFGGQGSSSEVTYNPRMFVWYASKKLLMFPAQLMDQDENTYRYTSAWQGALVVKVDAASGIKEEARITHIDMSTLGEKRKEECAKYSPSSLETQCYTHVTTGEEICVEPSQRQDYSYIPNYCFAEYDDSSYLAENVWNFYHSFVDRIVYIDDVVYTLSDEQIRSNQIGSGYASLDAELWK